MSGYGNTNKKICFDSNDKLHADLKIRLHYDDIKIKEFFNEVVIAYVNKDEHILAFIEQLKEKRLFQKNKTKKTKKARSGERKTIRQFGLDENEVERIFDILEKEHPEL